MYNENFQILKSIKVEKKVRKFTENMKFTENCEIRGKTKKFAEKWKNSTEKVNNLSLTIYDVIIRGQFFPNRPVSGTFHSLEKKCVPELAYSILLITNNCQSHMLNRTDNDIGNSGIEHIARGLKANKSLIYINMSGKMHFCVSIPFDTIIRKQLLGCRGEVCG